MGDIKQGFHSWNYGMRERWNKVFIVGAIGMERQMKKEIGMSKIEQVPENARGGSCAFCRELRASIRIEDSRGAEIWICLRCDRLIDWQEPKGSAMRYKSRGRWQQVEEATWR